MGLKYLEKDHLGECMSSWYNMEIFMWREKTRGLYQIYDGDIIKEYKYDTEHAPAQAIKKIVHWKPGFCIRNVKILGKDAKKIDLKTLCYEYGFECNSARFVHVNMDKVDVMPWCHADDNRYFDFMVKSMNAMCDFETVWAGCANALLDDACSDGNVACRFPNNCKVHVFKEKIRYDSENDVYYTDHDNALRFRDRPVDSLIDYINEVDPNLNNWLVVD